ncbi:glycosylphosphatidylinositol anchor biosynthesis [Xylographa soralifera]|nr:glycosylphosphatidylinositol anchor biosynthesis [Xylographa soralifera]
MRLPLLPLLSLLALPTLSTHTSNWAVLISTSRFWFNYRHLANVLSLYRTVKRLGIPDSQILLLLPDDMACNPRNAFAGSVYNNAARAIDLYGTNIEVDYRGYEVTVENFIRLLTDRLGADVPRGKRLGSDAGSNVLVYMTGHGGKEFLKFQDSEEIGAWDLADAFEQMWEKRRYHEMLFMIDTCQANTMYTKFYSPNIIATGSSALDQSSYSHHADNDVGVAVIDRYTYYNLEFLEQRVRGVGSEVTVGELFDSYDEGKIHSQPGVRWDLFRGGEEEGRKRLVMDFFGNVQGVEVDDGAAGWGGNESEWREDMRRLEEIWRRGKEMEREMQGGNATVDEAQGQVLKQEVKKRRMEGPAKIEAGSSWSQRIMGAGALLGCALAWGGASWLETSR